MEKKDIYCVIGYIDSYGAIHHRGLTTDDDYKTHEHFWPTCTHKTWRFLICDWKLEKSPLSKENITETESDDLYAFLRKHYTPPLWILEGEEWDALGRPRKGKKYNEHCKKWDKIYGRV